jgi:peptidoglycan/LPS O-acetylase OafA/YrhL
MAIPFFGLIVVAKDENFFQFIAYILALDFWYLGNGYGMWYISVSIFLYFLYPYLHKYIFKIESGAEVVKRGCFTIITFVVVFLSVHVFVPSYWEIVSFGIGKTTMFPVGMIAGYFAKHNQNVNNNFLIMYLSVMIVLLIVFKVLDKNYYEQIRTLIGIPVFTLFLNFVDRNQSLSIINKVLKWLGTYSLEIYILHLVF